jgi:hypothetical protein
MAAVATLKAMLGLDTKAYKASMKDARKSADSLKRKLAGVGAALGASFGLAAIVATTKSIINFASEIRHTADNLNVTTDELQALNAVAIKYGLSLEDVVKLMSKVRQSQGQVEQGLSTQVRALEKLNLEQKDFAGSRSIDALLQIARAYRKNKDDAGAFAAVADLLGRQGRRATAMLVEMSEVDMSQLIRDLKEMGKISSGDALTSIENFGTQMELLGLRMKNALIAPITAMNDMLDRYDALKKAEAEKPKQGGFLATIGEAFDRQHGRGPEGMRRMIDAMRGKGADLVADAKAAAGAKTAGTSQPPAADPVADFRAFNAKIVAETEKMARSRLTGHAKMADALARAEVDLAIKMAQAMDAGNRKAVHLYSARVKLLRKIFAEEVEAAQQAERDKISAVKESGTKAIEQERERLKEQAGIAGVGARTDRLASVGGSVGGSRAGIGMADRQLKIQIEAAAMRRRIIQIQEEQARDIKTIADATDRR